MARANKNLAGKVMQSVFMTKRVTLITTMGPDIFLLLRRLTNRGDIIHRAASPYGEVVYGSAEFQELAEQDLQTKLYIASPTVTKKRSPKSSSFWPPVGIFWFFTMTGDRAWKHW